MPILLCEEDPYRLINTPFQSFSKHEILVKLNLAIFPVLLCKWGRKSQKYFDLSTFN